VAAHLLMHEGEKYDRSLPCTHARRFACRPLQDGALKCKGGHLFLSLDSRAFSLSWRRA
jgi:hypothetical protein